MLRYHVSEDSYGPIIKVYDGDQLKGSVSVSRDELIGFYQWLYYGDVNIQDVLPLMSDDDRELLMTGITPDEWEKIFG